jgi:hypothetical protein
MYQWFCLVLFESGVFEYHIITKIVWVWRNKIQRKEVSRTYLCHEKLVESRADNMLWNRVGEQRNRDREETKEREREKEKREFLYSLYSSASITWEW